MNQNLKQRILTALVGVPVIVALLLFLGVEGVAFFAWVISMGMLYEYCRMFFNLEDATRKTVIALIVGTFIHAFYYVFNAQMSGQLLGLAPVFGFFILFLFLVPRLLRYGGSAALNSPEGGELLTKHVQELMALCFGMVYCVWFPLLMVAIRELNGGKFWVLLGLIIVWSNDTFAYFGGKFMGKHLLFETVSPKKTVEGAVTGVLGALVLGCLFAHVFLPDVPLWVLTVMILTVSASSIIGDLCESLIKRASKKKDSGSLLPGHGGFLDRFDGVIFALPTLYALLWLLA
jgi:phosphatidate cytidylyltransferase